MSLRPLWLSTLVLLALVPAASAQDATPVPAKPTEQAPADGGTPAPAPADSSAVAPATTTATPAEATTTATQAALPTELAAPAPAPRSDAPVRRYRATLVQHVAAGKQPTTAAITNDGATLLVTNRGDNTVSVYDTKTMDLSKTITEVGYSAWGVCASGQTCLVANWAGSSVAVLDLASGKRLGEIPVGMKPSYIVVSPDGTRVYAGGNFSGDVSIVDVKTRKLIRSLEVGRRPMGVAVSPNGRWLYVASCESRLIDKIDLKNEVVLEKMGAPLASTTNLAITPDGRKLLAVGDENRLLVIDAETGARDTVHVGLDPSSVAVTPDGGTALVANYGDDTVTLVDLASMEAYATVEVGHGPIDVQTDGTRIYTCNDKAGSVSAFKLEPLTVGTGL